MSINVTTAGGTTASTFSQYSDGTANDIHSRQLLDMGLKIFSFITLSLLLFTLIPTIILPCLHFLRLSFTEGRRSEQIKREREDIEHARSLSMYDLQAAMGITGTRITQEESEKKRQRNERKIMIRQLCVPVSTTLTAKHFPHLTHNGSKSKKLVEEAAIKIPVPGLFMDLAPGLAPKNRIVPGICAVCVSTLDLGASIVWSSNTTCPHVFHKSCIESCLIIQQQRPMCPVCLEDFIVVQNKDDSNVTNDPFVEAYNTLWQPAPIPKTTTVNKSHRHTPPSLSLSMSSSHDVEAPRSTKRSASLSSIPVSTNANNNNSKNNKENISQPPNMPLRKKSTHDPVVRKSSPKGERQRRSRSRSNDSHTLERLV